MAAFGSGAAARSIRGNAPLMNVDVGGGTSKIAVCADGEVIDITAVDVGARLIVLDDERRIVRLEEAGRRFGAELGLKLEPGMTLGDQELARLPRAWPIACSKPSRRLAARRRRRAVAARSADLARRRL